MYPIPVFLLQMRRTTRLDGAVSLPQQSHDWIFLCDDMSIHRHSLLRPRPHPCPTIRGWNCHLHCVRRSNRVKKYGKRRSNVWQPPAGNVQRTTIVPVRMPSQTLLWVTANVYDPKGENYNQTLSWQLRRPSDSRGTSLTLRFSFTLALAKAASKSSNVTDPLGWSPSVVPASSRLREPISVAKSQPMAMICL